MTQPPQNPWGNQQQPGQPQQAPQPYQVPQPGYGQPPPGYQQQPQSNYYQPAQPPVNQYPQVGYFGGEPEPKKSFPKWIMLVAILGPIVIVAAIITALNPKTDTRPQPTQVQAASTVPGNVKPTASVRAAAASVSTPLTTTAAQDSNSTTSSFNSSGLGQSKVDWEKAQGKSENKGGFDWYQSMTLQPLFQEDKVWNLQKVYRSTLPTIEVARVQAKAFSPKDAQLVKTYTAPNGSTVDLFLSQSLKDRFANEVWAGGEPGNFIVIFHLDVNSSKQVVSFTIAPGNNP